MNSIEHSLMVLFSPPFFGAIRCDKQGTPLLTGKETGNRAVDIPYRTWPLFLAVGRDRGRSDYRADAAITYRLRRRPTKYKYLKFVSLPYSKSRRIALFLYEKSWLLFFTAYIYYIIMRKTRVLTFLSLDWAIGSVLFSLSTSSFLPNLKTYLMPGHTNMGNLASLPLKCIYQLPESLERGWKAHYFFIHGLLICLIDLPFVFIRPEAKEKSYKERFFHAMHNGRASYGFLQLNEWRGES